MLAEAWEMLAYAMGGTERVTSLGYQRTTEFAISGQEFVERVDDCKLTSTSPTNAATTRSQFEFSSAPMSQGDRDILFREFRENLEKRGYKVYEDWYDWEWLPRRQSDDPPYPLAARRGTKEKNDQRLWVSAETTVSFGADAGKMLVSIAVVPACYIAAW
ncbi:hypothetical protein LO772_11570 [Yinghuangia sp. ASG 101]|uniref:hypothetical protein n=1 Tax=Yinghuangia sp. ASG 101 TaxID=2896848 RepID=UPI001E4EEF19|nr:hypothetical protein [Yinghuangia sp. ASG 101]UGQ14172.1 hypothetical protein LO772_11570 [Yinghuangia sp. ASG 101]